MRILHIEDDRAMAQTVAFMLKREGYHSYSTDLGEEGIDLAKLYDYDLIILDLGLPDLSGFEVLKTLRLNRVEIPVLILSGNLLVDAKVKALHLGADDYMTKPFHKDELIARIKAIVRRSRGYSYSTVVVSDLRLDMDQKMLSAKGKRVNLTRKEYQMMELLALHKSKLVTHEMFLDHLYGGRDEPEKKVVDVFACKLRKKIAAATGTLPTTYIQTIWGRGYKLDEPAPAVPMAATA